MLWPISMGFGAVLVLRGLLHRAGWQRPQHLGVPVVVVGNLVAGGAGKTPTVLALLHALRARGYTPGVISRGHGRHGVATLEVMPDARAAQAGDEPLVLRRRGGVPVFVGRDRVAAGRALLAAHAQVDIVVSDDGLQHHRLARDAQIIVFDERGAGNGWLLPAGPLREPLPGRAPPRTLVLYNAATPSTPLPGHCAARSLRGVVDLAGWWQGAPAQPAALHALRGRPVTAAAGIAHPQRFFAQLAQAGVTVTPMPLPDHHDFAQLPWAAGTTDVVVTEKDAVKLDPQRMGTTRVWVAALDFDPGAAFEAALAALLPRPRHAPDHGNPTA